MLRPPHDTPDLLAHCASGGHCQGPLTCRARKRRPAAAHRNQLSRLVGLSSDSVCQMRGLVPVAGHPRLPMHHLSAWWPFQPAYISVASICAVALCSSMLALWCGDSLVVGGPASGCLSMGAIHWRGSHVGNRVSAPSLVASGYARWRYLSMQSTRRVFDVPNCTPLNAKHSSAPM